MRAIKLGRDAIRQAMIPNAHFWNMLVDPSVSSRTFKKAYREFHEFRADVQRVAGKLSRRDLIRASAGLATAYGVASAFGSITFAGMEPASAATGTKKGPIRIGYINTLDCELLTYVIDQKKILQNMGWQVKFLQAPTGPAVMQAYIAGDIDFAYVGGPTPGLAAQKGVPLKLICGGMVGHGGWPVRNDLWSQGVTDIPKFFEYARKRRDQGNPVKIATQPPGTTTYLACLLTIMENGMDPEKDTDIKTLPPPEVSSSIVTGQVDANSICEQYDTYPEYFRTSRVIGHCLDRGPNMMTLEVGNPDNSYAQCTVMAARPDLDKERKLAVIEAHRKAAEWMKQNPKDAILIAAAIAGTPPAVEYVAEWRRARWHYGLNYESVVQQWNVGMTKIGMATKKLATDDLVDTSVAPELKAPFNAITGVTGHGPQDVTSDEFRKDAWSKAQGAIKIFKY